MDTRSKILTAEQALIAARGRSVFVAYFDVLTAPLIRQVCGMAASLNGPLTAIVLDTPDPLLTLRARAELAASLACVEAVIPLAGEAASFIERLKPANIVYWDAEDSARTAQLVEHVKTRYRSE